MSKEESLNKSWLDKISQVLSGEPKNKEELLEILQEAQRSSLIDMDAFTMIEGVLHVADMRADDIMVPKSRVIYISHDSSYSDILKTVTHSAHSRFPVTGENRDEVIGIMLAKDLLNYHAKENQDNFNLKDILRPAVFIPESKRLDALLKEFRSKRNHMAIVVDEYGIVTGIVTIEDVLEQIVGDIEDEHDLEDDILIKKVSDDKFTLKAITPIEDFNEFFNAKLNDEEFDTIGGLVVNGFGHLPKSGESIELFGFQFKILSADNRRVHLLQTSGNKA